MHEKIEHSDLEEIKKSTEINKEILEKLSKLSPEALLALKNAITNVKGEEVFIEDSPDSEEIKNVSKEENSKYDELINGISDGTIKSEDKFNKFAEKTSGPKIYVIGTPTDVEAGELVKALKTIDDFSNASLKTKREQFQITDYEIVKEPVDIINNLDRGDFFVLPKNEKTICQYLGLDDAGNILYSNLKTNKEGIIKTNKVVELYKLVRKK